MKKMLIMSLALVSLSGSIFAADTTATAAVKATKVETSKKAKATGARAEKAKAAVAAKKAANAADSSKFLALEVREVVKNKEGKPERTAWDQSKKWKSASILHKDGKRYRIYSVSSKEDATGTKVCVLEGSEAPKGHFGRSWLEGKNRCYYIPNDVNSPEKDAKRGASTKAASVTNVKDSTKGAVRAAKAKAAKTAAAKATASK